MVMRLCGSYAGGLFTYKGMVDVSGVRTKPNPIFSPQMMTTAHATPGALPSGRNVTFKKNALTLDETKSGPGQQLLRFSAQCLYSFYMMSECKVTAVEASDIITIKMLNITNIEMKQHLS